MLNARIKLGRGFLSPSTICEYFDHQILTITVPSLDGSEHEILRPKMYFVEQKIEICSWGIIKSNQINCVPRSASLKMIQDVQDANVC